MNENIRKTTLNDHLFDVIDTSSKAYWLGFFYADAYNGDKVNTVSIGLKGSDDTHLAKLADFFGLPQSKILRKITNAGNDVATLKLYSKYLCTKLTELGCPRAKSLILKYPNFLNYDLNNHFIRGLFDGDGCLTKRIANKEWKFSIASTIECLNNIKYIFSNLKINSYIRHISKIGNNSYELEVSGNAQIHRLMDWIYGESNESCRLDRKYDKYQELLLQQSNRGSRYVSNVIS